MIRLTKSQSQETIGDYPAAHSMDTTWFAIDRDGCIGCFFSDENGHVPSKVFEPLQEAIRSSPIDAWVVTGSEAKALSAGYFLGWDDLRDFMVRQLLAGLSAEFAAQAANRECHLDPHRLHGDEQVLLLPAHEALGLKLRQDERFLRIPDDSRCIITELFSRELFDSLHRDGLCRGCFAATEAGLGLYSYSHESAMNAPYERTRRPERRCNISQVREPYRRLFQLVHFDTLCFEDATELQPLEFEACVSWGSSAPEHNLWWVAWYDRDTNAIRPIRGKEREYAAQHKKIKLWAQDQEPWTSRSGHEIELQIEPPQDFPAAHSMDTNWFAVDRDGRVGFFRAAEDGHVPNQALCFGNFGQLENSEEAWPYLIHASLHLVATRFPNHHVLDLNLKELPVCTGSAMLRQTPGPFTPMAVRPGENRRRFQKAVLLCLNDRSELCNNSQQADIRVLANDANHSLVVASDLSVNVYRRLHTQGLCQGCLRWELPDTWLPKLLGLACYVERSDWSRLYVRQHFSTSQPLLLDDLHPTARDWFSRARFESVSFQEANEVLPLAHFPVKTYQDSCFYLDQLQTIRHIPGYEAAFRERSTWLLETVVENGWDIEPPPDFPAAHSGDVSWFAVDVEDNVGVFFASETSAIPWVEMAERNRVRTEDLAPDVAAQLVQQEQDLANTAYDCSDELLAAHLACESQRIMPEITKLPMDCARIGYEVEACLHPWNVDWYGEFDDNKGVSLVAMLDQPSLGAWVLLLRDLEAIRAELESGIAWLPPQRPCGRSIVAAFANLPNTTGRRLLQAGVCLGAKRDLQPIHICMGHGRPEWTARGFYAYVVAERHGETNGMENWGCFSHQYLRDLFPTTPLKSTSLPPHLRRLMERNRLSFSFERACFIQPELYFPCRRDTHELRFVDFKGAPTAELLTRPSFAEFCEHQRGEREQAIDEVRLHAANDQDFPAAHSGDVAWYAVDAEENVGLFCASETSAIPWIDPNEQAKIQRDCFDAAQNARFDRLRKELGEALPGRQHQFLEWHLEAESALVTRELEQLLRSPSKIGYEVHTCLHPWNDDWYGEFWDHERNRPFSFEPGEPNLGTWLVWLSDIRLVQRELERGQAALPPQSRQGDQGVVQFSDLPVALAKRLIGRGACLGLKRIWPTLTGLRGREEWAMRGIYHYLVVDRQDLAYGLTSSHQYLRDLFPISPLHIDELSARARRIVRRIKLPVSFREASFIQPELYVPCRRDVWPQKFVEFDGTPTARLLASTGFLEFVERQTAQREEALFEAMVSAESAGDYPAAHSMDVGWFATDSEGRVAHFFTGQDGSLPASWAYMPNHLVDRDKTRKEHQFATHKRCDNLDQFLLLEMARSCPTSILRNMVATPELRQRWLDSFLGDHLNAPWLAQAGLHPETHDGNILLRFNPAWQDDQLCPLIDGEDADGLIIAVANSFALTNEYQGEVILRTELCRLLLLSEISVSLARQIHADRACLGCLNIYHEPERMGVFRYECDSQQGAYQRIASPLDPLTLARLPMEVQEYLKCVQFNWLDFSQQQSIKVNEHQFCLEYGENSWRLDYQSGRVRLNVRDKSDTTYFSCLEQYRASYPKLLEWATQHGYTVETPPE